jgi:hypothetical protein
LGSHENVNSQGKNGQALIEHWDGTQWTLIESPIAGNATLLLGVTASSSTDITAVGYVQTSNVQFLPVSEHCGASAKSGQGGATLRRFDREWHDVGGRFVFPKADDAGVHGKSPHISNSASIGLDFRPRPER